MNAALRDKIANMRSQVSQFVDSENKIELDSAQLDGAAALASLENPYGNSTRGLALEYLGKGLKPLQVANLIEVTPAVISQFLAEPEFKELVDQRLAISQMAAQRRNDSIDALEDLLIKKVKDNINFIYKPMEMVSALKVVNGLQRRTAAASAGDVAPEQTVVQIQLPAFMLNSIVSVQLSAQNEIIEVNGQEMRTMPSTQLNSLLQKRNEQRQLIETTKNVEGTYDPKIFE